MSDSSSQGSYQYELNEDELPSTGVYSVIAVLQNCAPVALSPLAETLDPDALDALFSSGRPTPDEVSFAYCGFEVTVTSRAIRIEERDER